MSNRKRIKRPFVQVGPTNPSQAAILQAIKEPGLVIFRFEHDDGCKTIVSQRWEDCTCQDVDHRLLRLASPEQGGN